MARVQDAPARTALAVETAAVLTADAAIRTPDLTTLAAATAAEADHVAIDLPTPIAAPDAVAIPPAATLAEVTTTPVEATATTFIAANANPIVLTDSMTLARPNR